MGQASGGTTETPEAMTSDQPLPVKQSEVQAFLTRAASGCGGLLNSVMVVVGDKLGLYKTGQYSFDTETTRSAFSSSTPCRPGDAQTRGQHTHHLNTPPPTPIADEPHTRSSTTR
jgi:hypothetical protein